MYQVPLELLPDAKLFKDKSGGDNATKAKKDDNMDIDDDPIITEEDIKNAPRDDLDKDKFTKPDGQFDASAFTKQFPGMNMFNTSDFMGKDGKFDADAMLKGMKQNKNPTSFLDDLQNKYGSNLGTKSKTEL